MARAAGACARVAVAAAALALLAATVTAAYNEELKSLLAEDRDQSALFQNPGEPGFVESVLTAEDGEELVFTVAEGAPDACPKRAVFELPASSTFQGVTFGAGKLAVDECKSERAISLVETDGGRALVERATGIPEECDDLSYRVVSLFYDDDEMKMVLEIDDPEFLGPCFYGANPSATETEPSTQTSSPNEEINNPGPLDGNSDADSDADSDSDSRSDGAEDETSSNSSGGLAAGAIAGIGVGVGALALLALALLLCCLFRRKRSPGVKSGDRHSFSSASDVERAMPPAPPSLSTSTGALPAAGMAAGTGAAAAAAAAAAAGAATGGYSAEATAAALPAAEEKLVCKTVLSPLVVAYDPSVEPVSDADALRDGDTAAGVGIGEDGALPLHVSVALDTSELACSADHDDGDVRGVYARALAEMLAGMGDDVSMSLVSFSGDEAQVVETGGRIRADVDAAAEAVATIVPPSGARTSRATPKAAMRAVNACIGLLRETPASKRVAKRVLVVSGGGVEDGEMRQLRAQANGGRGWKTANCVVAAVVGPLAKMPAAVQLGAVALDVADVEEFAKPEVIGLVKALFAADDPRSVK